jgi:5-methylcytosine-specific restriction endonuclease McrA
MKITIVGSLQYSAERGLESNGIVLADCVQARRQLYHDIYVCQKRRPQKLGWIDGAADEWVFRDLLLKIENVAYDDDVALEIECFILRRERARENRRQEVDRLKRKVRNRRGSIPADELREAWKRCDGQCVLCGSREKLEFDHIVPVALGGSNTARNIQLLCEPCNRSKGATI